MKHYLLTLIFLVVFLFGNSFSACGYINYSIPDSDEVESLVSRINNSEYQFVITIDSTYLLGKDSVVQDSSFKIENEFYQVSVEKFDSKNEITVVNKTPRMTMTYLYKVDYNIFLNPLIGSCCDCLKDGTKIFVFSKTPFFDMSKIKTIKTYDLNKNWFIYEDGNIELHAKKKIKIDKN